jgi:hypothetical protein
MRAALVLAMLTIASAAQADPVPLAQLLAGTYTNEEQAYFDKEAGKPNAARWQSAEITVAGDMVRLRDIDWFGASTSKGEFPLKLAGNQLIGPNCTMIFAPSDGGYLGKPDAKACPNAGQGYWRVDKDGMTISEAAGQTLVFRRARPVTCWGSVPKTAKTPDGSEDWYFAGGLKIHDQGGRVLFGGGDTGAPPVVLRMRNVIWPTGTNKPSLVLYVHKPDNPDHAEAYSWADPGAKRIGINLRWMQASCTVDGQ